MTNEKDRLLTLKEVARYTGFTPHTLSRWANKGKGPARIKIGQSVRYRKSDVDLFLMSHRQATD